YARWIPLMWRMLEAEGLGIVDVEERAFRLTERARSAAWFDANPMDAEEMSARVTDSMLPFALLLSRCIEAIPDILSGTVRATEVLFPAGSMELVSNIYRSNEFSDAFNDVVAQTIRQHVQARL